MSDNTDLDTTVAQQDAWTSGAEPLSRFLKREVFFNVDNTVDQTGRIEELGRTGKLAMMSANLPEGRFMIFHTTKSDERLTKPFGGIMLWEACQMALRSKHDDGLLLQNSGKAFICIAKDELRRLLADGSPLRTR